MAMNLRVLVLSASFLLVAMLSLACLGVVYCGVSRKSAMDTSQLEVLVMECTVLAEEWNNGVITSLSIGNLPKSVQALSPQIVDVMNDDGIAVVDVQTRGGFSHAGYLIVCGTPESGYVPRKSNWRVRRVADKVFRYNE